MPLKQITNMAQAKISLLRQADDAADTLLRLTNTWLKPAAHVCLLSTFLDDALRMVFQWGDQANFFKSE